MINVHFDMETNDPDDYLTLCFLCGSPHVNLKGVTLYPGTSEQTAIVSQTLRDLNNSDVPIGSYDESDPHSITTIHYQFIANSLRKHTEKADGDPIEILDNSFKDESCILLTGAPLTNISDFLTSQPGCIGLWYAQGGFAGENIKRPQYKRFRKRSLVNTTNFGGDPDATNHLIKTNQISEIYLISKNVTHACKYDKEMHDRLKPFKENNIGLLKLYECMDIYLKTREHKKMHDVLTACIMINPDIAKFKEVDILYQKEKNRWGSTENINSRIHITTYYNDFKYFQTLTDTTPTEDLPYKNIL